MNFQMLVINSLTKSFRLNSSALFNHQNCFILFIASNLAEVQLTQMKLNDTFY